MKDILTSPEYHKLVLSTTLRFFLIYMVLKFALSGFSWTKFTTEINTNPALFLTTSLAVSVLYGLIVAYIKVKKQRHE